MCRATLPDIFPVDPGPTAAEEEGGRRAGGVCVCVCVCVCTAAPAPTYTPPLPARMRRLYLPAG